MISVEAFGQEAARYRAFFTNGFGADQPITDTLILRYYEPYDSTNFHVATFDLDQDGHDEIFVFEHTDCGSGGCMWRIFDLYRSRYLGSIEASTIFIKPGKPGQYPDLDGYWKMGWEDCAINQYKFASGTYTRSNTFYLKGPQIDAFFSKFPRTIQQGQEFR